MEFLSAAEPVTASVVGQRGASAPDATLYATGRSVLAIPQRVVVSPDVCAVRLGPRAQHVGFSNILNCSSLPPPRMSAMMSAFAVRLACVSSGSDRHVGRNQFKRECAVECAQRLAEVRVHLRFLKSRMNHSDCRFRSFRKWVAIRSNRLQHLQGGCVLAASVQGRRCVQQPEFSDGQIHLESGGRECKKDCVNAVL